MPSQQTQQNSQQHAFKNAPAMSEEAMAKAQADKEAREASDEQTDSPDYYRAIWKRTQKIFVGQVSDAVTDLSSLWYTAWIRAGRPPIPTPPKHVSDQSIWVEKPKQVINESSFPIVVICGAAGLLVVLLILLSRRL